MVKHRSKITAEFLGDEYDKLFTLNNAVQQSIRYAATVQQGILPQTRHFDRIFSDYFVLYKPQGIISGDLYWIGQKQSKKYIVVGDCTGHGVSGALLSVLALSFLNYLILGQNHASLGDILSAFDKKWIETFHQGSDILYNNDWLELGICEIDEVEKTIHFAGAITPLHYFKDGTLETIRGTKFPIGGWQLESQRNYTSFSVPYEAGSMLYMYSDGFKDQFGEKTKKRFTRKRLLKMLKDYNKIDCSQQKIIIEDILDRWQGKEEQTDDICLLGVRLS
jgi:serine phosphatase RsbU (regulator of sigma subunit)